VRWAGLAVVAAEAVATVIGLLTAAHPASIDPAVPVVWTVLLLIHAVAIIRLTATGTRLTGVAFGLAAFGLWALLCLMTPPLPTSNAPAGLAIALAGLAAVLWTPRESARPAAAAGLTAAMTVAFLSTVYLDTVLPYLGRWVASNAPPSSSYRLVDPVGLFILGALLAIAVVVTLPRPVRAERVVAA
jgi:hypothetical protein